MVTSVAAPTVPLPYDILCNAGKGDVRSGDVVDIVLCSGEEAQLSERRRRIIDWMSAS